MFHGSFLVVGILGGISSCPFQVALQSSDKFYVNISSPEVTFKIRFITVSCDSVPALP